MLNMDWQIAVRMHIFQAGWLTKYSKKNLSKAESPRAGTVGLFRYFSSQVIIFLPFLRKRAHSLYQEPL